MRFGRFRPEVLAAVSQAPSVKRAVRAAAVEIRKEARRRVPRDTGALARAIAVENVYDPETGLVEYRVGWRKRDGFYGPLVELGTEEHPPRPHLRPAADLVNNRLNSSAG